MRGGLCATPATQRVRSASVVEPFKHGRRDRLLASGRGMLAVVPWRVVAVAAAVVEGQIPPALPLLGPQVHQGSARRFTKGSGVSSDRTLLGGPLVAVQVAAIQPIDVHLCLCDVSAQRRQGAACRPAYCGDQLVL